MSRRRPGDVSHSGHTGSAREGRLTSQSGAKGKAPATRGSSGRKSVDEDESRAVQEEPRLRVQVTEEKGPESSWPDARCPGGGAGHFCVDLITE